MMTSVCYIHLHLDSNSQIGSRNRIYAPSNEILSERMAPVSEHVTPGMENSLTGGYLTQAIKRGNHNEGKAHTSYIY